MGTVRFVEDRKGRLEIGLLMLAMIGTTLVPVVWMTTKLFAFADYHLYPLPYVLGLGFMVIGLWLFYRSHTDLGTNWSVTLQMRENHRLITSGVYSMIRHPMYLACMSIVVSPANLFSSNGAGSLVGRCIRCSARFRRERSD